MLLVKLEIITPKKVSKLSMLSKMIFMKKITSIQLEGNINKLSIINGHSKPDFSEL